MTVSSERAHPDSPLDLIILLLAIDGESISGVTRLDKMIFLLYDMDIFPECFEYIQTGNKPYKYGPFVESLLDDLQALEAEWFLTWDGNEICLTDYGLIAGSIYRLTVDQIRMLLIVKLLTCDIDLNTLCGVCYRDTVHENDGEVIAIR